MELDKIVQTTSIMQPNNPIMPERFNSITKPCEYPLVNPELTSTSEPRGYPIVNPELTSITEPKFYR
jgi:hypothetical protein